MSFIYVYYLSCVLLPRLCPNQGHVLNLFYLWFKCTGNNQSPQHYFMHMTSYSRQASTQALSWLVENVLCILIFYPLPWVWAWALCVYIKHLHVSSKDTSKLNLMSLVDSLLVILIAFWDDSLSKSCNFPLNASWTTWLLSNQLC